jgi:hypothetical protein
MQSKLYLEHRICIQQISYQMNEKWLERPEGELFKWLEIISSTFLAFEDTIHIHVRPTKGFLSRVI